MKTFYILIILTFTFSLKIFLIAQNKGLTLSIDDEDLDRSLISSPVSYSPALRKATPAVVAVTTQQVVRRLYPGGSSNPREEFLRRYLGIPNFNNSRIEEEMVPAGIGSGVIVSPEGYTITNAHVITTDPRTGDVVEEVTVLLSDKREYQAKIIGFDRSTDVAVLKIESPDPLPHVSIANSDLLEVGDVVFAAGNPLGIGMTVTMGIISATQRSELGVLEQDGSYENFIQTDAAINRGNSGGALLDARGRLIGINTAIISQTGSSIGIGLAIPVNMVKKVLTDLVQEGSIRRGFLGVELASSKDGSGAVIEKIVPGSAADLAGFIPKDKIIRVGDRKVDSINQSRLVISQTAPGTKLPIDVIRSGKKITLFVTLDLMGSKNRLSIPGIVMEPLSLENRLEFQIPTTTKGVVVTNSTGDAETFKKGVVIVEVNGYQVNSVQDVEEQIKTGINRLYVWYRNKYRFLAYRVP